MAKQKYKSDQKIKYESVNDVVNFGFNRGKTIEYINSNDSGWFAWAKSNIKGFKLSKDIISELKLNPETYKTT